MFVILLRKHSFLREYYFPLPPILKVTGIHYKEFLNFIKYTGGQSVTFWDLPHPVVPRGFLPPPHLLCCLLCGSATWPQLAGPGQYLPQGQLNHRLVRALPWFHCDSLSQSDSLLGAFQGEPYRSERWVGRAHAARRKEARAGQSRTRAQTSHRGKLRGVDRI